MLFGIQLFRKDGSMVLETGYAFHGKPSQVHILADNERIVGFRARGYSGTHAAYHDFQFVIA